jgi:hypothetical protein
MGSRAWKRSTGAVALAVALLATACGSGTGRQRADGFEISTVAESTQSAGTARFVGSTHETIPRIDQPYDVEFDGEADFARDRSIWTGRVKQEDGSREGSSSISIGDDLYYTSIDESEALPDDSTAAEKPRKPWTHMSTAGFGGGRPSNADVLDVSTLLAELDDDAERQEIGTETLRGEPTTHYRFETSGFDLAAQVLATGNTSSSGGTVDVWVDRDQRLRRLDTASKDGESARRLEWFDFGAPVSIEPPAADQVMEDPYPPSEVTGDWVTVQEGRAGAVSWSIVRASATGDTECLSIEIDPPGPFDEATRDSVGRSIRTCGQRPPDGADADGLIDELTSHAWPLHDGRALLFGTTAPGVTDLVLHHRDGRTEHLSPVDRTFAIVLGADDLVNRIDPIVADRDIHCDLDDSFGEFNCSGSYGPQSPPSSLRPTGSTTCRRRPGSSQPARRRRRPCRRKLSQGRDIIAGCPSASVETVTIWS